MQMRLEFQMKIENYIQHTPLGLGEIVISIEYFSKPLAVDSCH